MISDVILENSINTAQASSSVYKELESLKERLIKKDTLVVNIVTDWCSDCTVRQKPNLPSFVKQLQEHKIDLIELTVQTQKGVYLSSAHQKITEEFGGHGFPRTVLIIGGETADSDNVEVLTAQELEQLAIRFVSKIKG